MPKNGIIGRSKKSGSNKATGRVYGASQLKSNRKHQSTRVVLNRTARKRNIYGKRYITGKDLSHGKDGTLRLELRSRNRSRNGRNGKSTKR